MNTPAEKKQKRTTILLLVLLAASLIGNIYQMRSGTQTEQAYDSKIDSMIVVRVELEKELASTQTELESYRGISTQLDSLLDDATDKIAAQEKKIKQLMASEKDSRKLNQQLKNELAELKKQREEYLERIDQLITENNLLKAQNESLNASVNSLSDEKRNLQQKVSTASQLKAEYVKISSFKKKGSGKYTETAIAKRTNKIDVCFTVMDNKIAAAGERMAYVVITEPGGKILAGSTKAEFTTVDGQSLSASASQKVDYANEKVNVCLAYENEERILVPGTYTIAIFVDGSEVANSAFALK